MSYFKKEPDFIAELQYLTTEDGGRKTSVFSGYRPHIEFDEISEIKTSGQQIFLDKEIVNPGDIVKAEITILASDQLLNKLRIGHKFIFFEGSRTIGTGIIIDFLNIQLKEK